MQEYLDFDLFLREREGKKIEVKVLGKSYYIKPELPAIVPVRLARAQAGMDEEETIRMSLQAADAIFGQEAIDEMCRNGLSAGELTELIHQVVKLIRGETSDAGDGEVLTDDAGHVAMRKKPGKK